MAPDGDKLPARRRLAAAAADLPDPAGQVAAREGLHRHLRRRRRHPDHVRAGPQAPGRRGGGGQGPGERAPRPRAGGRPLHHGDGRRRGLSRLGQAHAAGDPAGLAARRSRSSGFAAGSMGPKVEAAIEFVERTGKTAAIGALQDLVAISRGEGRDDRHRTRQTGWNSPAGRRSGPPAPPGGRAARARSRGARYGMSTRCDAAPPRPPCRPGPAPCAVRRSKGDSWIATAWILVNRATLTCRQSQPLRKRTAPPVTAQPRCATSGARRRRPRRAGRRAARGPTPSAAGRTAARSATATISQPLSSRRKARGWTRLPGDGREVQPGQHLVRGGPAARRGAGSERAIRAASALVLLAAAAAGRLHLHRRAPEQPVKRPFPDRQRLDPAQGDRGRRPE